MIPQRYRQLAAASLLSVVSAFFAAAVADEAGDFSAALGGDAVVCGDMLVTAVSHNSYGSLSHELVGMSLQTGETVWRYAFTEYAREFDMLAGPFDGGRVLIARGVAGRDGQRPSAWQVVAIEAASGRRLWAVRDHPERSRFFASEGHLVREWDGGHGGTVEVKDAWRGDSLSGFGLGVDEYVAMVIPRREGSILLLSSPSGLTARDAEGVRLGGFEAEGRIHEDSSCMLLSADRLAVLVRYGRYLDEGSRFVAGNASVAVLSLPELSLLEEKSVPLADADGELRLAVDGGRVRIQRQVPDFNRPRLPSVRMESFPPPTAADGR